MKELVEDLQIANDNLYSANQMLEKEIERLKKELEIEKDISDGMLETIDEAIEYIEERYNGEVLTHTFDKDNVGELLNILKGVDKE